MNNLRSWVGGICGLLLMSVIIGCSSTGTPLKSSNSSTTGSMLITVNWAPTKRLIPKMAASIVLDVTNTSGFSAHKVVSRPADGTSSTVQFPLVPTSQVQITATAFPTATGTGVAQASGHAVANINPGLVTSVTLSLNSTIDHLVINQINPLVVLGTTLQLVATPEDVNSALVLIDTAGGVAWNSSDATIAKIDDTGLVTPVSPGYVTITAIERESGVTATTQLYVTLNAGILNVLLQNPTISVAITPHQPSVAFGKSVQFSAAVTGSPDLQVRWGIQEGAVGGSITPAGLYTAPLATGSFHVIATSIANPASIDVVTVTVNATGNHPPTASFTATPVIGPLETVFQFDASASSDIEDPTSALTVRWDWNGDGVWDTDPTTVKTATHQFPAVGTYQVGLQVTDTLGAVSTSVQTITVVARGVGITPSSVNLGLNTTKQFTAVTTGLTNTAVTWAVVESTGGTVDNTGLYTSPGAEGTYHVTATSVEDTTLSATATIHVAAGSLVVVIDNPGVSVSLSPTPVKLTVGKQCAFTAYVTGTQYTALNWTVVETGGGMVTSSGVYTAPAMPGTYHVMITSLADPTKQAIATVTVTSGDLQVSIN